MKKKDVLKQYTTPVGAPAFVQGPHRFRRREYLNITYRTDREAVEGMVPEPLEIDQPLVRFEVMKMPDTTGYGAYVECGQAAVVRLGEEQGEFLVGMYLDNLPAIAAVRGGPRRGRWRSVAQRPTPAAAPVGLGGGRGGEQASPWSCAGRMHQDP